MVSPKAPVKEPYVMPKFTLVARIARSPLMPCLLPCKPALSKLQLCRHVGYKVNNVDGAASCGALCHLDLFAAKLNAQQLNQLLDLSPVCGGVELAGAPGKSKQNRQAGW